MSCVISYNSSYSSHIVFYLMYAIRLPVHSKERKLLLLINVSRLQSKAVSSSEISRGLFLISFGSNLCVLMSQKKEELSDCCAHATFY